MCVVMQMMPHACDMDLENQDMSGHKHEMIWANIGQTKIWKAENKNY